MARETSLKPTSGPGSARALAGAAVREQFDIVVAAGGDGTVNEVLNGIAEADGGLERTALAVLPLGTTNVFAREIRVPLNPSRAWEVVRAARQMRIDLPFSESSGARRYFAQLAGAGLDARAVERVNWSLKKRFGYFAYVIAALSALRAKAPPIAAAGGAGGASGELVLIGNGRLYGGNFNIFPGADLQDGLLEMVVYPRLTAMTVLRAVRGMFTGDFHSGAGTVQTQSASIELTCPAPTPFEVDGELAGHLPARFGLLPRALRVIAP